MRKCLKKRRELTKSGAGATKLPNCKFYNELLFLKDVLLNRQTESNITIPSTLGSRNNVVTDCPTERSEDFASSSIRSPPSTPMLTPPTVASGKKRSKRAEPSESSQTYEAAIVDKLSRELSTDGHFLMSLEPQLRSLPPRLNKKAKIEIQQLLFKYEFPEDSDELY